jgi:hypothetical protein
LLEYVVSHTSNIIDTRLSMLADQQLLQDQSGVPGPVVCLLYIRKAEKAVVLQRMCLLLVWPHIHSNWQCQRPTWVQVRAKHVLLGLSTSSQL